MHTQLADTQLAHTQLSHTQLTHTQLAHAQLAHTQLSHTQLWRHRPSLFVAGVGVALMALGWLWRRAWAPFAAVGRRSSLYGRRGTW